MAQGAVSCYISPMTMLAPRANLNDQVYETLRQRILTRDPGPGAKLSLHELAAELGVSRSPVHHALTRLVSEGLAERQGAPWLLRHARHVQGLLEGLRGAARPRAPRGRRRGRHGVGRAGRRSATAPHRDGRRRSRTRSGTRRTRSFHEAQVDLAGNKLLSRFYRELSVNLMMQVIRGGRVERHEHLVTEHEAIVSGFEARDRAMARAAITRHVESAAASPSRRSSAPAARSDQPLARGLTRARRSRRRVRTSRPGGPRGPAGAELRITPCRPPRPTAGGPSRASR